MANPTANDLLAQGGLLDTTALARMLGVSKRSLQNRRVRKEEFVPAIKIGRSLRFDPRDVEAFITRQRSASVDDASAISNTSKAEQSRHVARAVDEFVAARTGRNAPNR